MPQIPLIFSFWFMLSAYVVHILDESLLGGSFVEKVQQHWWPQYSWRKFFWFNAAYLLIMAASIVLYDRLGARFLFLPIAWALERFINSLWHIWWTVRFREYSPGLLTSLLIWMQTYFILVYHPETTPLTWQLVWPGVLLGSLFAAFLCFYMPFFASRNAQAQGRPVALNRSFH
jgi:ABC-type phosphate/phosphonate transport system permease subunit